MTTFISRTPQPGADKTWLLYCPTSADISFSINAYCDAKLYLQITNNMNMSFSIYLYGIFWCGFLPLPSPRSWVDLADHTGTNAWRQQGVGPRVPSSLHPPPSLPPLPLHWATNPKTFRTRYLAWALVRRGHTGEIILFEIFYPLYFGEMSERVSRGKQGNEFSRLHACVYFWLLCYPPILKQTLFRCASLLVTSPSLASLV